MRGTTNGAMEKAKANDISIHVPREGHDLDSSSIMPMAALFLSTCPVRGTTMY